MKKLASTVAGLAMLVAMAGPAAAATTPKAYTAKSSAPIAAKAAKCSNHKGSHNKCVSQRMHATSKKTTPTTSKKK